MRALRGIKRKKKVSCSTKVETKGQGGRDKETIAEIMYCNSWGWDKETEGKQILETGARRKGTKEEGCAKAGRRGKAWWGKETCKLRRKSEQTVASAQSWLLQGRLGTEGGTWHGVMAGGKGKKVGKQFFI